MVLVCGAVVRLKRKDESTYPASLWLKEKTSSSNISILIWIFEEIDEMQAEFMVSNPEGRILDAKGDVHSIFGFEQSELLERRFTQLLPNINYVDGKLDIEQLHQLKFFGGRSKRGLTFPVITRVGEFDKSMRSGIILNATPQTPTPPSSSTSSTYPHTLATDPHTIQIISMPHIAGVVTIFEDGRIHSINNVFAKYLFGQSAKELH
eukprot:jgi/Hompol1/859/HPOL_001345-RA